jgi:hypothetical protein
MLFINDLQIPQVYQFYWVHLTKVGYTIKKNTSMVILKIGCGVGNNNHQPKAAFVIMGCAELNGQNLQGDFNSINDTQHRMWSVN